MVQSVSKVTGLRPSSYSYQSTISNSCPGKLPIQHINLLTECVGTLSANGMISFY